jgi:hypothetical protein
VQDDVELEDKVIAMQRGGKFSIRDMLAQPIEAAEAGPNGDPPPATAAEPDVELPPLDDISPLPGQGDAYKAYSRASNKPVPSLVILMADASARGFSYANLDTMDLVASADPGQGPEIVLTFCNNKEVRLEGRNVDLLYTYIQFHRVSWIRVRPPSRDFIPAGETVITGAKISKLDA